MEIKGNYCSECGEPNNRTLKNCHNCGGEINLQQGKTKNGISVFSSKEFLSVTRKMQPNHWSMTHWEGLSFQCVCGKPHNFSQNKVKILGALSKARLIFVCPEGSGMVCVHPKGVFKVTGFESLFGTLSVENVIDVSAVVVPAEEPGSEAVSRPEEESSSKQGSEIDQNPHMDKYRPIEKELIELYKGFNESMGADDAEKMAIDFVDVAIEKSKQTPLYAAEGIGVKYFQKLSQAQEPERQHEYNEKTKDGVTEEDFIWWWDLDDVERYCLMGWDDITRVAMRLKLQEENTLSSSEAEKLVNKHSPRYKWWGYPTEETGEDRPLPVELKNRVNKYLGSSSVRSEDIRGEVERMSSFNAFIRKKIREGRL